MLKKIAVVVVALIVGVLALAATRPDTFRVARAATIGAPPEKIYPLIADLRQWTAWSPYEKRDPAMKRSFSGAPSGKGAIYAWSGDRSVGAGRMEIVDADPPSKLVIRLDFEEPLESRSTAEFMLAPKGGTTEVVWVMHGPTTYVAKLIGMFVSMDAMIGKDFDAGLASLKAAAER